MPAGGIRPGLYAITDPALLPGERLFTGVEAALRGGAVMVQYRDKKATPRARRYRAEKLRDLCDRHQTPLIINDDLDLAVALAGPGVHLGTGDAALDEARSRLPSGALLGATCHDDLERARSAAAVPCDYLAFGRFFPSRTKPGAPAASLKTLGRARQLGLPVSAIGGITPDNAARVVSAGADLVAMVHGLFGADDIEGRARELAKIIHEAAARRDRQP